MRKFETYFPKGTTETVFKKQGASDKLANAMFTTFFPLNYPIYNPKDTYSSLVEKAKRYNGNDDECTTALKELCYIHLVIEDTMWAGKYLALEKGLREQVGLATDTSIILENMQDVQKIVCETTSEFNELRETRGQPRLETYAPTDEDSDALEWIKLL